LACPFFLPTRKADTITWLHPSRLPLGAGWAGECCAPGHEGSPPSAEELRDFCNLGYATACPHLPRERSYDAVRFSIARDRGSRLVVWFVCEAGHRPAGHSPADHGKLEYDLADGQWTNSHPNAQIQKMAECYLESYLLRRSQASGFRSGANS
jgi:hypothetical protein